MIDSLNKIYRKLTRICDKIGDITDESNPMSEADTEDAIEDIADYMKEIADEAEEQIKQLLILIGNLDMYANEHTTTIMADINKIFKDVKGSGDEYLKIADDSEWRKFNSNSDKCNLRSYNHSRRLSWYRSGFIRYSPDERGNPEKGERFR